MALQRGVSGTDGHELVGRMLGRASEGLGTQEKKRGQEIHTERTGGVQIRSEVLCKSQGAVELCSEAEATHLNLSRTLQGRTTQTHIRTQSQTYVFLSHVPSFIEAMHRFDSDSSHFSTYC